MKAFIIAAIFAAIVAHRVLKPRREENAYTRMDDALRRRNDTRACKKACDTAYYDAMQAYWREKDEREARERRAQMLDEQARFRRLVAPVFERETA